MTLLFATLRVHQWVKNLLVFLPMLLAHLFWMQNLWLSLIIAFFALCAAASGGYIVNDILDAPSDRLHPGKKHRPIAAGKIAPLTARLLAAICFISATVLSWMISREFLMLVAGYVIVTYFYSRYFKHTALLDIFCLASFYSFRIFAGGLAAGVEISQWFLAFSTFFFLNLAFLKRYTELRVMEQKTGATVARGYLTSEDTLLNIFGVVSGYISVLVLSLYINGESVVKLYHRPNWLWAACFVLLFWLSRTWLVARRGKMQDDPVVFVLTDPTSYACILLVAVFGLMAI